MIKAIFLALVLATTSSAAQTVRLDGPEVAGIGEIITISLYATPPAWADTLQGVFGVLLNWDHNAMTFVDATSFMPPAWVGAFGLVTSGCRIPDQHNNDPYVNLGMHDAFTVSEECPVVVGGCATECFYNEWDPWDTGGSEVLVGSARFMLLTGDGTSVGFPNSECAPGLSWIEWNYCNGVLEPDIVGRNAANDPPTVVTNGVVQINGGASDVLPVDASTFTEVKELYR